MLKVGEERARDLNFPQEMVSFKVENAEELSFKDNEFSAYTISFGIRNVTHIDKVIYIIGWISFTLSTSAIIVF